MAPEPGAPPQRSPITATDATDAPAATATATATAAAAADDESDEDARPGRLARLRRPLLVVAVLAGLGAGGWFGADALGLLPAPPPAVAKSSAKRKSPPDPAEALDGLRHAIAEGRATDVWLGDLREASADAVDARVVLAEGLSAAIDAADEETAARHLDELRELARADGSVPATHATLARALADAHRRARERDDGTAAAARLDELVAATARLDRLPVVDEVTSALLLECHASGDAAARAHALEALRAIGGDDALAARAILALADALLAEHAAARLAGEDDAARSHLDELRAVTARLAAEDGRPRLARALFDAHATSRSGAQLDELRALAAASSDGAVRVELARALYNEHKEAVSTLDAESADTSSPSAAAVDGPAPAEGAAVPAAASADGDIPAEGADDERAAALLDELRTLADHGDEPVRDRLAKALYHDYRYAWGHLADERAARCLRELREIATRSAASDVQRLALASALHVAFVDALSRIAATEDTTASAGAESSPDAEALLDEIRALCADTDRAGRAPLELTLEHALERARADGDAVRADELAAELEHVRTAPDPAPPSDAVPSPVAASVDAPTDVDE